MHSSEGKNEVPQKAGGGEIKSKQGGLNFDRSRDTSSIASRGRAKSVNIDVDGFIGLAVGK